MSSNKDYVLALYHQQGVKDLFDEYAPTFDEHLEKGLRYNVPALLYEQWKKYCGLSALNNNMKCLDLGCGTGLAGEVFRKDFHYLEGVDLSGGMCQQARKKNVYDKVIHATLLSHMQKTSADSFDLVLSADVFMYVLDLPAVLAESVRILKPGGWLIFSTEFLEDDSKESIVRRETERFAHKRDFVIASVGPLLDLKNVEHVCLRMDEGKPVMGNLFVFVKAESGSNLGIDTTANQ